MVRNRIILFIASLFLFLSVSCDDLHDPVWGGPRYGERVAGSITSVDGVPIEKAEYFYAEEKLVAKIIYDRIGSQWVEGARFLISYEGDRALCELQVIEDMEWLTLQMSESRYRDGRILEEIFFMPTAEDIWIPDSRYVYLYNGTKMTGWTGTKLLSSGFEQPIRQGVMQYDAGFLRSIQLCVYTLEGVLQATDRKDLTYIDGRLTGYTRQIASPQTQNSVGYRFDYRYAGSLLSEIFVYPYNPLLGYWEPTPMEMAFFDYSSNGTLVGGGFEFEGHERYTEYMYERGSGNARFFELEFEDRLLEYPTVRSATRQRALAPYAETLFHKIQ